MVQLQADLNQAPPATQTLINAIKDPLKGHAVVVLGATREPPLLVEVVDEFFQ